ncbi:MAG: hypothetical protein WA188_16020 [Terriglobales bacterium]
MENFLTLCWGLLALAALVAWRCQATQARAVQRRGLVALLCVLALMLPVISATDDLHPIAQVIEDSPAKRTQKAWATIKPVVTHVRYGSPPAVLVLASIAVPPACSVEWFRPAAAPSLQAGSAPFATWRAPPALTL